MLLSPQFRRSLGGLLPALALCAGAGAASLSGPQLVAAIDGGGYVILMRHAQSPRTPPDAATADPRNIRRERQLDETGRATARAMGDALRQLRLPVGKVLSSPTYRALETARLARLPKPETFDELGDAGNSMSADLTGKRAAWLRARVAQVPKAGTDTLIITHYPNISEAFPDDARDLSEGEALIFHPDAKGAGALLGRVKIEDWPRLASGR
ncbi:MAG TPA: histidine phosphatase family protein [Steroidobacteraceae bacterium]|nr:histidine phosphatase family protein [Steroidobacteraceae bacterium]